MSTSRIETTPAPARESIGLFAVIKSKRVILPLKGLECDFSVLSGTAEVSMTQIFRQENKRPLDCEYLFPLPADASVYCCEADINGRTIRARVREREEARQLAAEKKAAGFRTALVEAERENLFTLSLGNVQPGDLVTIQLKYFQTLRSLAGQPSIEIPFCPGIRYIPGRPLLRSNSGKGIIDDTDEAPDASRITPVRIDAAHPDAAYIDVRGVLDGKFVKAAEVTSPSHAIEVEQAGEQLRVSLSGKGEVPDRDFVLRWRDENAEAIAPRAWVREEEGETYALLEIRAPQKAAAERAPMDFYFLVDRSGSMHGEKWNKAAEALQSCMEVLGPDDRAMVTFFESGFCDFAERPLSVEKLLKCKEFYALKDMGTDGGTEICPALEHVLAVAAKHSATQCKNLILITDAQVGNDSAVLELMQSARDFPVHCFGIDVALNDSLLLALCRQQGGTFHSLNPRDNIQQALASLGKTLGRPVLLNLELSDGWELADAAIPNLYAGQIHYLSARSRNGKPLELRGRDAASQKVKIQFERQAQALDAPYLHWCRSRIQRLLAEEKDADAVALSVQSNLICRLTAFVAWDESEKVPISTHELVQPVLLHDFMGSSLLFREFKAHDESILRHKWMESGPPTELCDRLISRTVQRQMSPTVGSAALNELRLQRKLSKFCRKIGVPDWERLVKVIFDWIDAAGDVDRAQRLEAVVKLFQEAEMTALIMRHRKTKDRANEAPEEVHKLLKEFVEKLSQP